MTVSDCISAPQSYGTMPIGPANNLRTKSPGSFLPYTVDLACLTPDPYTDHNDPIIALSLSGKPSGDGELALAFLRLHEDGCHATWWEWAGVAGRNYRLRLKAKTRSGRIHDWLIGQVCDPTLAPYPLPPAPIPGFGAPLIWSEGDAMFCPTQNLPPLTIAAAGTTQLTAAVVSQLAVLLINGGSGGGVMIAVPAATWGGQSMPFAIRAGGPVTLYLYSGDQFESLGANVGYVLQDGQNGTLRVSQSGAVIVGG